jgi:acyl carrier protein
MTPSRSELLAAVTQTIVEMKPAIDRGSIREDTGLYTDATDGGGSALGLDSLDALELITVLQQRFDTTLAEGIDLTTVRTIADVIDGIALSLSAGSPSAP